MSKLGSINLEKLHHVKRKMKGKDGMIDVIVLPIKANGFYVGEKSTNLNFKIVELSSPDQYDNDGFITHERPVKTILGQDKKWGSMTDEEKEKVNAARPILGNFRDFSNQNSGYQEADVMDDSDDEEDDLPF